MCRRRIPTSQQERFLCWFGRWTQQRRGDISQDRFATVGLCLRESTLPADLGADRHGFDRAPQSHEGGATGNQPVQCQAPVLGERDRTLGIEQKVRAPSTAKKIYWSYSFTYLPGRSTCTVMRCT